MSGALVMHLSFDLSSSERQCDTHFFFSFLLWKNKRIIEVVFSFDCGGVGLAGWQASMRKTKTCPFLDQVRKVNPDPTCK